MAHPMDAAVAACNTRLPVAVAFSGGADSSALLFAAAARWPGEVIALHVHHGLQAAADAFESHCRSVCARLGLPLYVARVDARHSPGDSPEDAARRARYEALAELAHEHGAATVLVAQHADDQVETVLLALSRGAGLPGLSAMPPWFERHGIVFLRPLLGVPGPVIREWLAQRGEPFVEDPTNADVSYTRNRIRHRLLPALQDAFPQFRETFARSARHAAEAQRVLVEVAAQDFADLGGDMRIAGVQRLARERQGNLLRHWLKTVHETSASAAQLDELLDQVAACTTRGHRIRLKVGQGFVERVGDVLRYTQR